MAGCCACLLNRETARRAVATGPNIPERTTDYDFGEPVGAALVAGETAGEASAGVVSDDDPGDDCGFAGAGDVCGDG